MDFLFDSFASLLSFFYGLVPNYAVAIILLTLLVMVLLTPLTLKGTRSMMVMQQLQPEIRKIQNKYKDDRQRLNEELMNFYKENNLNPVGGCLPLLIQAPVFIVLYTVLRGLTRRETDVGYPLGWITGEGGAGVPITDPAEWLRPFDPAYVAPDSALYESLRGQTEMMAFGLDLSESAAQVMGESFVAAIPYLILILIVGVSGFVQQKQIQGRIPKNQVNPQQQVIMKVVPIMLPIFSYGLPGGLVLYFAVSNMYRIGQQWWISRSIYGLKRGETVETKRAKENGTSGPVVSGAIDTEAVEAEADETPAPTSRKRGLRRSSGSTSPDDGTDDKDQNEPSGGDSGRSSRASDGTSRRVTPKKGSGGGSSQTRNRKNKKR